MQVISHRGYWKISGEKNTGIAFERSFSLNFGTETDIRDQAGNLVISHDIATGDCMSVHDFFAIYKKYQHHPPLPLALNIKANGLQFQLQKLIELYNIVDYFVFDMSVPDTIGFIEKGMRFYSRQSEHELHPAFYDDCAGIWLDAFYGTWYTTELIMDHIKRDKEVAIVSPELHKRDHLSLWNQLKKNCLHHTQNVILCTDLPEEAAVFFNRNED